MLKRLRLKFMVMASLMLALIGFSSLNNEAMAQVAAGSVCPDVPFTIGWIDLGVSTSSDFTAGFLGTIESFNGSNIAGSDWLFNNGSFLNTTQVGSQLVSWWSEKNGRNTLLQVLNTSGISGVNVHVQILGKDCVELKDFCDTLTPADTVTYDLSNLVSNAGQSIATGVLAGHEGIITVTPVNNCTAKKAVEFNELQGNMRITNANGDDYGTNVYARPAEEFRGTCTSNTSVTCVRNKDCPKGDTCGPLDGSGCAGKTLSGLPGCRLTQVLPTDLNAPFSTLGSGGAGSDLVLISFNDSYGPPYAPVANTKNPTLFSPGLFDDQENFQSCTSFTACFTRLGIDLPIPVSENFSPVVTPTPTATPIACSSDAQCPSGFVCVIPTPAPGGTPGPGVCVQVSTPSPTPTKKPSGGGGGGGCSIGGPAEIGTAMANVLVPLVPAFAIGFRVLRRKSRKNQKK